MLSGTMQKAMNDQLNAETYSAYLYWSMAAYFERLNLKGFANWMKVQAQEEMAHAVKFFDQLNERGGAVTLTAIEAPQTEWESPLAAFEHTCKHEGVVTDRINRLVDLAIKESDHASNNFLQWFVAEQVEEEASADEIRQRLKLAGDSPNALLMIDQALGQRVFVNPLTAGEGGG